MRTLFAKLQRLAELAAAVMFAAMFGAFVLQVFMRYVVNRPLGWTLEACLIAYLWIVFWGAAFLVRERQHVAFNLLYAGAAPPLRRALAIASSLLIGASFVAAFPATWEFVRFMRIDTTWVLELRFDLVFSVFLLFMLAVIVRAAIRVVALLGPRWRSHL